MRLNRSFLFTAATFAGLVIALGSICAPPLRAQGNAPKFEVDPSWPKPLPDHWVLGQVGGVCADSQDHVFIENRRDLNENNLDAGTQAPPIIEFDAAGNVVKSWEESDALPRGLHSCTIDYQNNVWLVGSGDGTVQKWSHDGSKMLLQIGKKGVFDSSDGTNKGKELNASHTLLYRPDAVAIDPTNGDIYLADGADGHNHRLVVFDRNGQYLRQWGMRLTKAEVDSGSDYVPEMHCVVLGNDGLVYVCDRSSLHVGLGDEIQVFDKMGKFQREIPVRFEQRTQYTPKKTDAARKGPGAWGTVIDLGFSRDPAQKYIYVCNEDDEEVDILDHASGKLLSSFGRAGHQAGEFQHAHMLTVDSKGNVYVGEVQEGERVQKFKIVGGQ